MIKKILAYTVFVLSCVAFAPLRTANARTLWSGSFVPLSVKMDLIKVSVNYPSIGKGKICGVELKSQTMILNKAVWERVVQGLVFSAEYDDGAPQTIVPIIEVAEGPRMYVVFEDKGASYASLVISTRDGSALGDYFLRAIGSGSSEAVIAVAIECLNTSVQAP